MKIVVKIKYPNMINFTSVNVAVNKKKAARALNAVYDLCNLHISIKFGSNTTLEEGKFVFTFINFHKLYE